MARRGRPTADLILSDEERETLARWARRPTSSQQLALRSRIVLACADGATNTEVAGQLSVSRPTVGKWRSRFVADRLDGLVDEPRSGAPRTITDEQVERVVADTLETTPRDATHWSRASMAAHSGLSRSTVGRIWRAFRLQPHRAETFKLSRDPLFIDKVRDVVGLYLDPPERAIVLSVDEKTQVQALDRSAPVLFVAEVADQQFERVTVGADRVRRIAAQPGQVAGQEPAQEYREVSGHHDGPAVTGGTTSPMTCCTRAVMSG